MTEGALAGAARRILEAAWDDQRGYCFPHPDVYPHLWLWDSCFHAIAWAALGDRRATRELAAVFVAQLAGGFVPHMRYAGETIRRGPLDHASSFTQPPVYAHAAASLADRGLAVSEAVVTAAAAGLEWLWGNRMTADGLLFVVHPWETGADDSPRWDSWIGSTKWNRDTWTTADFEMRDAARFDHEGAAVSSPRFEAAPAAFNAIAAHAAAEMGRLTGEVRWKQRAGDLASAVDGVLWNDEVGLWSDLAVTGGGDSVHVPTLDGALPALVTAAEAHARRALAALADPSRFRAPFGLRYLPAGHPAYEPGGYWRGSSWMQLNYLAALAARRWDDEGLFAHIAASSAAAARASGFAEHWHPETAASLGAVPQTWSALVVAFAPDLPEDEAPTAPQAR